MKALGDVSVARENGPRDEWRRPEEGAITRRVSKEVRRRVEGVKIS